MSFSKKEGRSFLLGEHLPKGGGEYCVEEKERKKNQVNDGVRNEKWSSQRVITELLHKKKEDLILEKGRSRHGKGLSGWGQQKGDTFKTLID